MHQLWSFLCQLTNISHFLIRFYSTPIVTHTHDIIASMEGTREGVYVYDHFKRGEKARFSPYIIQMLHISLKSKKYMEK